MGPDGITGRTARGAAAGGVGESLAGDWADALRVKARAKRAVKARMDLFLELNGETISTGESLHCKEDAVDGCRVAAWTLLRRGADATGEVSG
jgi:hypothetical protein